MGGCVISSRSAVRRGAALSYMATVPRDATLALVAANRDAGTDLLRRHTARVGALFGWEALTLATLAARIALPQLVARNLSPATGMLRESLCAHVVERARAAGHLGRFTGMASQPGFARCLADSFDELALEGLPEGALSGPDPDLARLWEDYRTALTAAGLIDAAGVLSLAELALRKGDQPTLGGRPIDALVLLDVPLRHRTEGAFANRLLAAVSSHRCTVPSGDERALRWLVDGSANTAITDTREPAKTPLAGLQDALFRDALGSVDAPPHAPREPDPPPEPDSQAAKPVQVLSAPGEARECVELARRLLWAAEAGTPFERMAILPRRSRPYHDALTTALSRAGIPAFFASAGRRPDPNGRALLALLACRSEGLSARRFAEYLSLSVVPKPEAPGTAKDATAERDSVHGDHDHFVLPASALYAPGEPQSTDAETDSDPAHPDDAVVDGGLRRPARWERLLGDAAVIGGEGRWRLRLDGLQARLELGITHRTARGEDTADLALKLEDLQHLRSFALPVIARLASLPERGSWSVFQAALTELASATLRRPERVLAVLSETSPLAALGEATLDDVRRVLQAPLSELPAPPTGNAAGRVFVGDASEARGRCFDIVCIPGLCEKVFPEKLREDPLLLDALRQGLSDDLRTQRDRALEERLCLRLAVGAAERQLILSYPRLDSQRMRARVPSFYGLEVLRAAEGRLPGYAELMVRAERATDARIGWPAPRSSLDAIDAAEHDLSVLEAPLHRQRSANRGDARYLLEVNPHLARALRFRARRWTLARFTPADGLVDPAPGARAALAAHRLASRAYSPTALEAYASCPYRFYLKAIVGLRSDPLPEPLERLGPLEAGALFHSVQRQVLSSLRDAGQLPLVAEGLPKALQTLDAAVDATAERYRARLAPAVERVFRDGVEAIRADLRQWLTRASSAPQWVPTHFELGFGLTPGADEGEERDGASVEAPLALLDGRLKLRGAIDLVERNNGRLRATDHKTGACTEPEQLRIAGGTTLQPALYGLALRVLFPESDIDSGRLYFCTTRGGFDTRTVPIDAAVEGAVARLADTLDVALEEGFLPAAPADKACDHCDYRVVCGPYEAQRVQRKRPDRLRPLLTLRNEP